MKNNKMWIIGILLVSMCIPSGYLLVHWNEGLYTGIFVCLVIIEALTQAILEIIFRK